MQRVNTTTSHRPRRTTSRLAAGVLVLGLVAAACGDDDDDDTATSTPATGATTAPAGTEPATTEPMTTEPDGTEPMTTEPEGTEPDGTAVEIDEARCAENEAAGPITYLSSFDFAAAASILDVVVAEEKGYFEALCLDVELRPSFSTSNYPLVASDQAQFSSAGSYTEILNFSRDGAEFVAFANYGKSPIEALIVPERGAATLADLAGGTIGVKGDLPPSIVALLASEGLLRGEDYQEVLLDGFDPQAHLQQDIDALPVYKSNEPGQLDAAGVAYTMFDPTDAGIPGSFGLLYTSRSFYEEHPGAVADFARAALKGMEDAIADPEGAVDIAVAMIDAAGNQNFLTRDGELFRWQAELAEVQRGTADGDPVGLIDPELLQTEYDAYVAAGVWPEGAAPENTESYDADLAVGLYDADGKVIWPG